MQISLVVFLIVLLIFAVVSYRLAFRMRFYGMQFLSKAAFTFLVFVLIPLALVVRHQARAKSELTRIGIIPHPSLTEAVGIATGRSLRDERRWLFHSQQRPANVLGFYRDSITRPEWRLTLESPVMLILQRGSQRLTIAANTSATETVVMYSLRDTTVRTR